MKLLLVAIASLAAAEKPNMVTCYNQNGDRTLQPYACPEGTRVREDLASFCSNDDDDDDDDGEPLDIKTHKNRVFHGHARRLFGSDKKKTKAKHVQSDPVCSDEFCCESDPCPSECRTCVADETPLIDGVCPTYCAGGLCGNTLPFVGGTDCRACGPCPSDTQTVDTCYGPSGPAGTNTVDFSAGSSDPASVAVTPDYDIPRDETYPAPNPIDADVGWYYKGTGSPNKINWYFYQAFEQGTTTPEADLYPGVAGGLQKIGDLGGAYAVVKLYNWGGSTSALPFFSTYTIPDASSGRCNNNNGAGSVGSSWYKERYTNSVLEDKTAFDALYGATGAGTSLEFFLFYGEDVPTLRADLPHVRLTISAGTTCLNTDYTDDDELLYIALSTSSSAAVPPEFALIEYGWSVGNQIFQYFL